jgi:nitroreductase
MKTLQSIEVFNAIYERRAVRQYTPEPVSRESIEELVNAAIQAPSAMNVQPWAFVVVRGRELLKTYSDRAKAHLLSLPDGPVSQAMPMLGDDVNIFHEAPALVVICATSEDAQAAEDCSLAAQNLILAAFSEGFGTCPIGFARPWLSLAEAKREVGIPSEWRPVFPIVIGSPDEEPESHGRRPAQIIWTGET